MSQEKNLAFQIVVIKHGFTAIVKTVENFVKSHVINANHLQIYRFYTLPTLTTNHELNNWLICRWKIIIIFCVCNSLIFNWNICAHLSCFCIHHWLLLNITSKNTSISFSSSNAQFYESRISCLFTFWVFFPDKSFKLI